MIYRQDAETPRRQVKTEDRKQKAEGRRQAIGFFLTQSRSNVFTGSLTNV